MRPNILLQALALRPAMMASVMLCVGAVPAFAKTDLYAQPGTQLTWGYKADSAESSYQPYYGQSGTLKPNQQTARTDLPEPADKKVWDVTLGVGAMEEPKYPGSKFYHLMPIPMISVIYEDTYFLKTSGLGMNAVNWNGLKAGPVLGFDSGRNHHDDSRLNKMGNIEPSVNGGGFVSFTTGPFEVSSVVKQALTHMDSYGLTGNVAASYRYSILPKKLDFSAGPVVDFADGNYMRTWFGVTPGQAAASGFSPFTPRGGIEDVGVNTSLTYHYTQHILFRTFLNFKELVGDAANSPLTTSAAQFTGGVGVAYHF